MATWTNSLLKQNAWTNLKPHYWQAVGVTLLAGIMGANSGGGGFSSSLSSSNSDSFEQGFQQGYSSASGGQSFDGDIAAIMAIVVVVIWLFALAWTFFLGNVTRCGENGYFVKARDGHADFNDLFGNFRNGNYMPTVKTMFFRDLYVFLWSLLFVIPGIIKTYEYYLVPYLLSENPKLSKERCFEISKKTMDGEKWNLFVLQLSFIGWVCLAVLTCGIGIIFLNPYMEATMAEFYLCMRAKMLSFGYATEEELTGNYGGFGGGNGGYNGGGYNGNPYDSDDSSGYTSGTTAYGQTTYGGSSYDSSQSYGGRPYDNQSYGGQNNSYTAPPSYGSPDSYSSDRYSTPVQPTAPPAQPVQPAEPAKPESTEMPGIGDMSSFEGFDSYSSSYSQNDGEEINPYNESSPYDD